MSKRTIRGRLLKLDGSEFETPWVRAEDYAQWAPALPRPLILVNGCFDILHAGHLYILEAAQRVARGSLGPRLQSRISGVHAEPGARGSVLVSLDSDSMVRAAKGSTRPVHSFAERAAQLQYLPVDYIHECASNEDFLALCSAWRPDARVRNEEYRSKPSRIQGVREIWLPTLSESSTTETLRRLESGG